MDWAEIYTRLSADRNDPEAWADLESRVTPWARRSLWQRGWHVIEDAVADTCSTVVMSLDKARGAETFSGFVYGYFLNVRRRMLQEPIVQPVPDDTSSQAEEGPAEDELDLLRRCLDELSARERHAVELRYFEEATAEEIASALGVSEVNARQVVFRGLGRLRDCAKREWPSGRG